MNAFKCVVLVVLLSQCVWAGELRLIAQEPYRSPESAMNGAFINGQFSTVVIADDSQLRLGARQFPMADAPEQIQFSPAADYLAVLQRGVTNSDGDTEVSVGVLSAQLQPVYTVAAVQFLDEAIPLIRISDIEGRLLIARPATGNMWFYDGAGRLAGEVQLYDDPRHDPERFLDAGFDHEGNVVVLATRRGSAPQDAGAPEANGEPLLSKYDERGRLIWRQQLRGFAVNKMTIGANGEIVVNPYKIYNNGTLVSGSALFNAAGEEVVRLNRHFKFAAVSGGGERLLSANNRTAILMDVASGQLVLEYQLKKEDGILLAAELLRDQMVLLTAREQWRDNRFNFDRIRLTQVDAAGQVQEIEEIAGSSSLPRLVIDQSQQKAALVLDDRHLVYEVQP